MFYDDALSLHDNLVQNGFRHERVGKTSRHDIIVGRKRVFCGEAYAVSKWLNHLVMVSTGPEDTQQQ